MGHSVLFILCKSTTKLGEVYGGVLDLRPPDLGGMQRLEEKRCLSQLVKTVCWLSPQYHAGEFAFVIVGVLLRYRSVLLFVPCSREREPCYKNLRQFLSNSYFSLGSKALFFG